MGERIRGAIFNSLGAKVVDAVVLDAFAGTGALGLEAISRGAKSLTLVDNDRLAARSIKENTSKVDDCDREKIILARYPVDRFIKQSLNYKFDLIFVDPPYDAVDIKLLSRLASLLTSDGILVVSSPKKLGLSKIVGLKLIKLTEYADARIGYYQI